MLAPSLASRLTIAAPMPRLPPVISAVLFLSGLFIDVSICFSFTGSSWVSRLTVKSVGRDCPKYNEERQNNDLSIFEWRLCLSRSYRLKKRYLQERLHDRDKDIEVEGQHGTDHIASTPPIVEATIVTSISGRRQS